MKKIIIALVAMVLTTGAFAQAPGGFGGGFGGGQFNPEEMVKRQADRMKETYKLNDEQYAKVLKFFQNQQKAQMERMQKMMEGGQPQQFDMESFRKEREAQQKAQSDSLKAIFTAEQFAEYEKQQKEMQERMRERQAQGGGQGFGGGFGGGMPMGGGF
ncbi:MAG: hypothetical protein MJY95_01915 [Bacteroidaceae bacterium]|nr:hypothetical protein [Bacteroidaceae bacterium]